MKFGKQLEHEAVAEWRPFYLDYNKMKRALKAIKRISQNEEADVEISPEAAAKVIAELHAIGIDIEHTPNADKQFWIKTMDEVHKINEFYAKKRYDNTHRLAQLRLQMQLVNDLKSITSRNLRKRQLKKATIELYRSTQLLQNYVMLNTTAFTKITKKHDKLTGYSTKKDFVAFIEVQPFSQKAEVAEFLAEIETFFSVAFEQGSRAKAMNVLRVPMNRLNKQQMPFILLGLFLGFTISLIVYAIVALATTPHHTDPVTKGLPPPLNSYPHFVPVWLMFRGLGMPILMAFWFGVNTYVWHHKRINYSFIFGYNIRTKLSYGELLMNSAILAAIWAGFVALYIMAGRGVFHSVVPPEYYPLILYAVMFCYMLCPLDIFYRSARFWLLRKIFRIITAPWAVVEFPDFFLADLITSLTSMLYDWQFALCYYSADVWRPGSSFCLNTMNPYIRPPLAAFPAFWRFLQCLRRFEGSRDNDHMFNAGKYFTVFPTTLFNFLYSFYPYSEIYAFWVVFSTIEVVYKLYWDNVMDWGVLNLRTSQGLLRNTLTFPKWFYYYAIISNILMRFAYVFVLSRYWLHIGFSYELYLTIFLVVEAFRRFQWSFIRLENEHVNNCGKFRATKDIPLPFDEDVNDMFHDTTLDNHPMPELEDEKDEGLTHRTSTATKGGGDIVEV